MYLYGGVGWLLPALVGHKYIFPIGDAVAQPFAQPFT